jgi:peptidoglycan/LPS O-acetylase OafA/YrhL
VAAMLVAISHLVGVFWGMRAFVALATSSPVQPGPLPAAFGWISYKWFEPGPFGVALFFLISGLVIPFSLEKHTRWTFLISRLLRIYPTFILVLLVEALALYLASRYWRAPFVYNTGEIISNCLLVSSITGYPDIDFVNWTLSIEIKFYVLMMLAAPSIRSGKLSAIFAIAIVITLINFVLSRHVDGSEMFNLFTVLHGISLESPYLIFMLIGVLFNFHDRGFFGYTVLFGSIIGLTCMFTWSWRLGLQSAGYPIVTANYFEAILVFTGLYILRTRIKNNSVINFMALISFPFYLIHAIIGFTLMKFFMITLNFDYYLALLCAVVSIIAIASILHYTIENATINAGRQLAKRSENRQTP